MAGNQSSGPNQAKPNQNKPATTTKALGVVDTTIKAATAYKREDLAYRLEATKSILGKPDVRVMVVGEFKQGKSSLVNALVNAPVCPVDDDVATSVPTVVRYAEEANASLIRPPGASGDDSTPEPIDFQAVPVYASEMGNPGNERGLLAVEIGLPRNLLRDGIVVVDTPGVGGLGSPHTAATVAALPTADVVLFVSDASQELTRAEFEFLQAANEICPATGFVMTKTDFYPNWQQIRDLNAGHLQGFGEPIPIFNTSAALRQKAIESNDKTLNTESGYPDLIQFIGKRTRQVTDQVMSTAVADLRSVVLQLTSTFEGERQVLEDPDTVGGVMAEFERAKERSTALKDQAARWQVTMNDGIADLNADFDHRLRGRLRQTTIEAEAAIEDQEPGKIWEQFEQWLRRRVSHDLAQTYLELARRTQDLSQQVADHFEDGQSALAVQLDASGALTVAESIDARASIEPIKMKAGGKALTAVRGSYGGLLMFSVMSGMVGLAALGPVAPAAGMLMGRKAIKDERERQLTMQRQKAKVTARQYIDDTSFEIGKQMKDSLRTLHRQLRDHYQSRAEEMNRSIATSMAAAKQALSSSNQQRDARLKDVKAELTRLAALANEVEALAPSSGSGG